MHGNSHHLTQLTNNSWEICFHSSLRAICFAIEGGAKVVKLLAPLDHHCYTDTQPPDTLPKTIIVGQYKIKYIC